MDRFPFENLDPTEFEEFCFELLSDLPEFRNVDWRKGTPKRASPADRGRDIVAEVEKTDVHRVASLAQRWLLGTHQGGVKPGHMQAYLDEFAFRFNRRRSRASGMLFYRLLEQAVQAPPRTYRSLVVDPGSARRNPPAPPPNKRVRPDTLASDPSIAHGVGIRAHSGTR
jgi:hypothetical protein